MKSLNTLFFGFIYIYIKGIVLIQSFFIFQSGTLSDQASNESGAGVGGAGSDTSNAVEPSGDQLAMESSERDTPSHAYNGPPPPAPPPHNRRQNPPHHQAHHPLSK